MQDDGLVWKIAIGIVLGALAIGGIRSCQQQVALNQFNEQMASITATAQLESARMQADLKIRAEKQRQEENLKHQAEMQAKQLLPGQRCIGKNLFNRVENGWVQVTDGSAAKKCGKG